MKSLAILGSTGSIGTQTLDLARDNPELFDVVALGAASSVAELARQAAEFSPRVVAIADVDKATELKELLPDGTDLLAGPEACAQAGLEAEVVVNGVVGFDGLGVTLETLKAGKRLALANKESLIAAGPLVQAVRRTPGAELLPVDSEHCAVHQCLGLGGGAGAPAPAVERIILTASGGPFRGRTRAELKDVSIQDALAHPTWSMGPKITIDSSTLMNKGLEVIEAHELFCLGGDLGYDRIDVVVHPQSVVHSMVEYVDGATLAQLSLPDMRLCIGYAISFPQRLPQAFGRIDWKQLRSLDFEEPDLKAFSCLGLAYEAGRQGETAPAALNAANEIAVQAFLDAKIGWLDISEVIAEVLEGRQNIAASDIDAVLEADRASRVAATEIIEARL